MKEFLSNSVFFGLMITIAGYEAGLLLKKKWKKAVFNPLLISIAFVIAVLILFEIEYATYSSGAQYLSYLLTPATVCLAVPLFEQLTLLRQNKTAVIAGITAGVLTSLTSILCFSILFGLTHEQYVTLLPKSITTAIGMGISEELGGVVTITVAVIVITGIIGNIFADTVCRLFRICHPIAKGLAIGTSSHVCGTAKAMELGDVEGAMSGLAVAVAGLLTVIGASVFAGFY